MCAGCVPPPLPQTIMERPDAMYAEVKDTRTKEEIEAAIAEDESKARAVVLEMVRGWPLAGPCLGFLLGQYPAM